MSYYADTLARIRQWSHRDVEEANFYYDITDTSREYLAHLVSVVTGIRFDTAIGYCAELLADGELRAHLQGATATEGYGSDIRFEYGRRVGWYAFTRATKPTMIVETGVEHGVGSCLLANALIRNAAEGHPGRYYGTDINPRAGGLFNGSKYAVAGEILYGDSIESLSQLAGPIDLFINDSDHSAEYELREYETVAGKLGTDALILGDNAHVTTSLSQFARATDRQFLFWHEAPKDHWYPGSGMGVAWRT